MQPPLSRPRFGRVFPIIGLLVVGLLTVMLFLQPRKPLISDIPQAMLTKLDGTPLQLASGKPTVVTVFATWCPYCQRQLPQFEQVARKNPRVQFAFINDGEPTELVQKFHAARDFTQATLYQDRQRQVALALKVTGYPANFFYNSKGKLVGEVRGYITGEQLEGILTRMN
jgi:thiol-disulfide isomerase/thioredoxin